VFSNCRNVDSVQSQSPSLSGSKFQIVSLPSDETNLFVPGNTDVDLADTFRHVIQWTDANDDKMIVNQCKTK